MAERLNAPVLKTGKPSRVSRVRIPVSPPVFNYLILNITRFLTLLLEDIYQKAYTESS